MEFLCGAMKVTATDTHGLGLPANRDFDSHVLSIRKTSSHAICHDKIKTTKIDVGSRFLLRLYSYLTSYMVILFATYNPFPVMRESKTLL